MGVATIMGSKTDHARHVGQPIRVFPSINPAFDVRSAMVEYLHRTAAWRVGRNPARTPLFLRATPPHEAHTSKSLASIIQRCLNAANLKDYTPGCLRPGAITAGRKAGFSNEALYDLGRWRSWETFYNRYCKLALPASFGNLLDLHGAPAQPHSPSVPPRRNASSPAVVRSLSSSPIGAVLAFPASASAEDGEEDASPPPPPVRVRAPRVRFAPSQPSPVRAPRRHRPPPFGVAVPPEAPLPPLAVRNAWLAEVDWLVAPGTTVHGARPPHVATTRARSAL